MKNDDYLLDAIKRSIIESINETADIGLLDYIHKLLIAESRQQAADSFKVVI